MPLPRAEDAVGHGGASRLHGLRGRERCALAGGDAVFHGGKVVRQTIHDCSIQKSAASIRKLAELAFESFLPGHAAIAVGDWGRHVRLAAEACRRLFVPKNLV